MNSRPQFSLRTLLFVVVMVCLGAAAAEPGRVYLRVGLCFLFPAMLVVGAVQGRGYLRAFCIGAALPALAPTCIAVLLLTVFCGIANETRSFFDFVKSMTFSARAVSVLWALSPCCGLAGVLLHWLLKLDAAKGERGDHA